MENFNEILDFKRNENHFIELTEKQISKDFRRKLTKGKLSEDQFKLKLAKWDTAH